MGIRAGRGALFGLVMLSVAPVLEAGAVLHHQLSVELAPQTGELHATDRLSFASGAPNRLEFVLHRGLDPTLKGSHGSLERLGPVEGKPCIRFALVRQAGQKRAVVRYEGGLQVGGRQQNGQEVEEGSFLTPKDSWYPQFRKYHRITFDLAVELPPGWEAVSQGQRTELLKGKKIKWSEQHPQLGIYLVVGPYRRYQGLGERAQAMVYLRQGDQDLAHRYLEVTHQYIDLYSRLLGSYPYSKFAAVEGFWGTGYGVPSFTLLGPKVMRLPFILHTSYPHEILHNWWGNGVYVDSTRGNWSEGLTAYLADHLHQERQGEGWRYRRAQLQQYTLYVAQHGKERPLSGFQARHSQASQAIGYGKGLLFFHMLRQRLGGKRFITALRHFYREDRFQRAGFADLRRAFEHVSGRDLRPFFRQWVERRGSPELRLEAVEVSRVEGERYRVWGKLRQIQAGAPYRLQVPLLILTEQQGQIVEKRLAMQGRSLRWEVSLEKAPQKVAVDPRFDLFRRLHPEEMPPTLDSLFSAKPLWLILPNQAPPALRKAYSEMARHWASRRSQVQIRWDTQIEELPTKGALWLLGWQNRFRKEFVNQLPDSKTRLAGERLQIGGKPFERSSASLALVAHEGSRPVGFLASERPKALASLTRKLPHYGQSSYVLFQGDAPNNRLEEKWPVSGSPLVFSVSGAKDERPQVPPHPALTTFLSGHQ